MKITLLTGKTYNIEQAFDFELRVIKNPRAKKLTLRIDSKERLPVLTIPRYCSQKRAIQFVEEHRLWIKEALSRIPEHKLFEDGETIPLFGKEVTIVHAPERRLGAKLDGSTLLVSGEAEFLHRRVKDFIKKKAQRVFAPLQKIRQEVRRQHQRRHNQRHQIPLGQLLIVEPSQLQLAHSFSP